MIGIGDREYMAIRFERFADEVLRPAVCPLRAPLELGVWQPDGPAQFDAACRAEYRAVNPGFRWGPVWSTAWFRLRGSVPGEMAGARVAVRFSAGTEALAWQDGSPRRALDDHRDRLVLFAPAHGGESVDLLVEAACNLPLGISTFFWDDPEVRARWREDKPGRVESCELVTFDAEIWRLTVAYDLARKLAVALPENDPRGRELIEGLRELTNALPAAADVATLRDAAPRLERLLRGEARSPKTTCVAVGHAHLDTAWLWPLRETRRKALRSWSNAVELCRGFDDFRFVASQPQQYAWVERDAPALFEQIRGLVTEGRWEPAGPMWVEPDAWCPSGESLVRQLLHGTRYFDARFPGRPAQRCLFLPDTFGFPASLPQMMRLAGLDTFVTNKLSWCERNEYPHTTFRWRGIDGSEVRTHFTPGNNYNAPLDAADLHRGEARLLRKDHTIVRAAGARPRTWLQPFGHGDGGGGPTSEMAQRATLAANVEGLPRVVQGGLGDFAERLHQECDRQNGADLPVWDGELYLELHRGTWTSQSWLKNANAAAERGLRRLEALLASLPDTDLAEELAGELDATWKTVLLHQFHDILPGTSIGEVYVEARAELERVAQWIDEAGARALGALARACAATGSPSRVLVYNPCSHTRDGWFRVGDREGRALAVPPLGWSVIRGDEAAPTRVQVDDRGLDNGRVRVRLDDSGEIAELRCAAAESCVNAAGDDGRLVPLNRLVAYEDRPRRWEAWDIDFDYADKPIPLPDRAEEIAVVASPAGSGAIEVRRRLGESEIRLRYVLHPGSPYVEVEGEVDWRERATLLRVLHPTGIRARRATCGIAFGHLDRPTHRNTSWEEARFEVPGQRWIDLSQPGLGLALLDVAHFGRSCEHGTLGLSLLRAPGFPDAAADFGSQRFRYALLPHRGDWRAARVPEHADALAEPLQAIEVHGADARAAGPIAHDRPFTLRYPEHGSPEVAAFKRAEDGDGLVLRVVERHGGRLPLEIEWHVAAGNVSACDLLERRSDRSVEHDAAAQSTRAVLRPFEILSLRIRP